MPHRLPVLRELPADVLSKVWVSDLQRVPDGGMDQAVSSESPRGLNEGCPEGLKHRVERFFGKA